MPAALVCSAVACVCNTLSTTVFNKTAGLKKLKEAKFGDSGSNSKVIPLSDENTRVVYFVRDTYNPKNIINVLDENKSRVYSFERSSKGKFCGVKGEKFVPWDMITANHRQVIGAVGFKKGKAWVEFCNKGDLQFRLVKSLGKCKKKFQQFKYRSDEVARFRWYKRTMTLDKISPSLSSSCSMCRQRVAIARKLSFLQCKSPLKKCLQKCQKFTIVDYEVVYDASLIDRELLVATSFISMMTQWAKMKKSVSVGSSKKIGCCLASKKAKIKMVKLKAMAKAKRLLNSGCQATEMKKSMGMEKVAATKAVAYKFMGGRVAPTAQNPSGDPTYGRSVKCKATKPGMACVKKICQKPAGCLPSMQCLPCMPVPSACGPPAPMCPRPPTAPRCPAPSVVAPVPVQPQPVCIPQMAYNPMMPMAMSMPMPMTMPMTVPMTAPQAQCSINIQPQPTSCSMTYQQQPAYQQQQQQQQQQQLLPPPPRVPSATPLLPPISSYCPPEGLARPCSSRGSFCPPRPPTPYKVNDCAYMQSTCRSAPCASAPCSPALACPSPSARCGGSVKKSSCGKKQKSRGGSGKKKNCMAVSFCGNEMKRGFYR